MEGYQANMLQLNAGAEEVGYRRPGAPPQADGLFHPLDCEPTLHIGYEPYSSNSDKLNFKPLILGWASLLIGPSWGFNSASTED